MTIKLGDKVRVTNEYSNYIGKVGIVFRVPTIDVYGRIGFDDGDYCSFSKIDVELVEVANYVPVPKFKIGDVVYDKNGKKYLILEEREDDLFYHCWAYANDNDFFREEKELTLEEPKEQPKDE